MASELTALIRVENLRFAPPKQSFFKGIHAEVGQQRVAQSPVQNVVAEPVDGSAQVQKTLDIGTYVMSVDQT